MSFHHSSSSYPQYHDYNSPPYPNQQPDAVSPASPVYANTNFSQSFAFHPSQSRAQQAMHSRAPSHYLASPVSNAPPSSPPSHHLQQPQSACPQHEQEIRHLRKKVRELELMNESARLRVRELEAEISKDPHHASSINSSIMGGLPSPLPTPAPQSASFQASWKARTEARVRHFCSLNRAGNALCAWHDSRRERRAFPPRMAPPGQLNCGCTYEEALFEESLARHGVGSYHPGETVRMDPALRNPLLKLLQRRYGYRDGDFERDPKTGDWVPGEGHAYWEQRAQAVTNSRKARGEK